MASSSCAASPARSRSTRRSTGAGADPYGNERLGLSGSAVIDRTEFGISWNAPLPNGALTVAEQVRLVLDVEAVKAAS